MREKSDTRLAGELNRVTALKAERWVKLQSDLQMRLNKHFSDIQYEGEPYNEKFINFDYSFVFSHT